MEPPSLVMWFVFVAMTCLLIGFLWGVYVEQKSWKATGDQDPKWGRTAHHCDGKFYLVIPESDFNREFVHREAIEWNGGDLPRS